jgi:preprotein translocase subunit SecA
MGEGAIAVLREVHADLSLRLSPTLSFPPPSWSTRLQKWRGVPIETDLARYQTTLHEIDRRGENLADRSDAQLQEIASALRNRAQRGSASNELEDLVVEVFALVIEAAHRVLGMRPFDVQVMAAIALRTSADLTRRVSRSY